MLFDTSAVNWDHVLFDQEAIRELNPQRGDMEHLNGIIHHAPEVEGIIGFKDVRQDEFWVPGHIPGRPLLPGVIMLEAAAQVASFYTKKYVGWTGFIGFGGVENTKFRAQVVPGQRLHIITRKTWMRHRRIGCDTQGWVSGQLVFETQIIGVQF